MDLKLDLVRTVVAFVVVIAIGTGGLLALPIGMTTDTVFMMVLPSMIVFGGLMLLIGVAHGQHRAGR